MEIKKNRKRKEGKEERGKRSKEEKNKGRKMEKQKGKEESKKTLENESQIKIIKLFLSMNRSKKISYVRHSLPQT